MKAKLLMVVGVIAFTLAACDDNTVEMGTSITPQSDSLNVAVDTFTVSTNSVLADSVLARTATGYIGKVKDPETGSYYRELSVSCRGFHHQQSQRQGGCRLM